MGPPNLCSWICLQSSNILYSPCGRWVAAFSRWNAIWLWDLHNTIVKEPHTLESGDDFERCSVAFSHAGNQLAIGKADGSVHIFDPQSGDRLSSLQTAQETVGALAYSPIGQQLAISGGNNSIYLWDGQSQEPSIKLDGHSARILSIAYSPCGQWIDSGSEDRTVRLWRRWQEGEAESWQSAGVVRPFFDNVLDIAWNPVIPMEFVTRCEDRSVGVWRMSIDGESVVVRMFWGTDIRTLCAEGLTFKDATDLSPMNQKLLIRRGAVDNPLVLEDNGMNAKKCAMMVVE